MEAQLNEYELTAEKFLTDCAIRFSSRYVGYDKYFDDDREFRHIFDCKLSRVIDGSLKVATFRFGQSIAAGSEKPSAYDLLTCITKNDPDTFENFCSEYGYSDDSIKAKKTYSLVKSEWKKVSKFFSENELEALQEIN